MRTQATALFLTVMLGTGIFGSGVAQAQTRLDHDVQKMWDDTFNPGPRGDARTNFERRRDADRREWCRANAAYERCREYR